MAATTIKAWPGIWWGPVPVSDLPAFMEKIIQTYLDRRTPDERFLDFTRRHTEEELRELLVA